VRPKAIPREILETFMDVGVKWKNMAHNMRAPLLCTAVISFLLRENARLALGPNPGIFPRPY